MNACTTARAAVAALLVSAAALQADFLVPAFRGGPDTTYQQWEVFQSPGGPNPPDVANFNPNGTANVVETTGSAFLTSGGNIYSPAVATDFIATIPDYGYGAGYITDVVVQIRIQGTDLDVSSVLWNGVAPDSTTLLFSQVLGGFGGTLRDYAFEWNGLPGNLALNALTFQAAGSSMSLDRLAVDTQTAAIPEANALLLAGLASGGIVVARVRRRSA